MVAHREARPARLGRGDGWGSRIFGVVTDARTWLQAAYLLLSFPIGVVAFVLLLTLLSLGWGMAITLVGLPILVATMYGWCAFVDGDRALTNALLGTHVPPLPFRDERGYHSWQWARIQKRLANPYTWRALGFAFARFPHGIAAFVILNVFLLAPLWALSVPFHYYATHPDLGPGIQIDTLGEALLYALPAPFIFLLGLHIVRGAAWLSAAGTSAMLGRTAMAPETDAPRWETDPTSDPAADIVEWRGLRLSGTLDPHAAAVQSRQIAAFRVHLIVYASLATLLAVINALSTPGVPWALWPAWALAIPLGIHAGYLAWGWPGAHIGLFAVVNGGLLAIDLAYSDGFWFYWPLLGWGAGLLLTTFAVLQYRRLSPSRSWPVSSDDLDLGPAPPSQPGPAIAVDIDMRRVTVDGREVELTPKEFDLLVLLYENPGRPFNRGELLDRIWKNDYEVTERTVDACVVRLRRKLGGRAEAIQTVWGVGYRYQPANGAPGEPGR